MSLTIFKTVQISQINCSPLLLIWSSFNFPGNSQIIVFPDLDYSQCDLCSREDLFQNVELFFFLLNVSEDLPASCPTMTKAPSVARPEAQALASVFIASLLDNTPKFGHHSSSSIKGDALALQQNAE